MCNRNTNKGDYISPKVKTIKFSVDRGYECSTCDLFDAISTTGYSSIFGSGGRAAGTSFWDMGEGDGSFSTTGYEQSNDWSWD